MTEVEQLEASTVRERGPDRTPGRVAASARRARMRLRRLAARLHRLRRPLRIGWVCALAFIGALLGLWLGGASSHDVGPVSATMRFSPSLEGGAVLNLPPLGTLELNSHAPPLRLAITVDEIDSQEAEAIFNDPRMLTGLEQRVLDDLRSGLILTGIRGTISATLGALVVTFIVMRRWRPVLASTAVSAAVVVGSYGIAWGTWDERSLAEPRYTGLLAGAPSFIGNVSEIAEDFGEYRGILAGLVTNVTQLYHASSTLPTFSPDDSVIRLLHISDLELNPSSWDVVSSVTQQYSVDLIVDTGDTTDHGTTTENLYLDAIPGLRVPYVWVRGNHDSSSTQNYMNALENVTVLDGSPATVEGIRFLGAGDPRFTPDRSSRNTEEESRAVITQAEAIANVAANDAEPIDVIAYHDPDGAPLFDGLTPLVLAGHKHDRDRQLMPEGTRLMVEGSTGADGLRALQQGEPAPIELSLLYLDAETKELQAWDEITLGGLGLASANIERFHVDVSGEEDEVTTPTPYPTPTEPVPSSPLPTATLTSPPETSPTDEEADDETDESPPEDNEAGSDGSPTTEEEPDGSQ